MKKPKKAIEKAEKPPRRNYLADVAGIGFLFLFLYLFIALLSYSPADAGAAGVTRNWAGPLGHFPIHHAILFCGLGVIALVPYSAALGISLLRHHTRRRVLTLSAGFALLTMALASLTQIYLPAFTLDGHLLQTGGWLGVETGARAVEVANTPGATLLFAAVFIAGFLLTTGISLRRAMQAVGAFGRLQIQGLRNVGNWFSVRLEQKRRHKEFMLRRAQEGPPAPKPRARKRRKADAAPAQPVEPPIRPRREKAPMEIRTREIPKVQASLNMDNKSGGFTLPPLSLLNAPGNQTVPVDRKGIEMNSRLLEKKLADFNVEGHVVAVQPGPVVTMYEVEPGPGVKVQKFVNLSDDLAMAMRAVSIRVVAPIPGKNVVGIEIPNQERENVYLADILTSPEYSDTKRKIPIALGKDITGLPIVSDLAQMPHLLVAGSTGSGKSVSVNAMICSVLYRYTADRVKFVMIDPKMIELSAYDGIPHLRTPVITDPKRAAIALRRCVDEMEKRYELMKAVGRAKDLDMFNKRVEDMRKAKGKAEIMIPSEEPGGGEEALELEPLPYWIIIIDELADLMMVAKKDIEDSIARLTAKARAAGLHLIVATQRPSVDVITGVIKSNLPTRLSFQVSSAVDSKTILDGSGAENLLGQGDSLFIPPKTSRQIRVHGAFLGDDEIAGIVEFLRKQGIPEYDDSLLKAKPGEGDDASEGGGGGGEHDALYDEVVAFVMQSKRASTSAIQRKFAIGYNRAARILDQMEEAGLVGPPNGSSPRELLRESI